MKKKDLQILTNLRKNARMSLTMMSKKTGIPISTIFQRLKHQENDIITRHTCLLDFNKLGYNTLACIKLKVAREDKEALGKHLKFSPVVNTAYKINNGYDYFVQAVFKQLREAEEFIEKIEGRYKIEDKQTFFIIDDIKREEFMTEEPLMN